MKTPLILAEYNENMSYYQRISAYRDLSGLEEEKKRPEPKLGALEEARNAVTGYWVKCMVLARKRGAYMGSQDTSAPKP